MKANLYLHKDAFVYNGVDTSEEFASKLSCLVKDMRDVICEQSDENIFHVHDELFQIPLFEQEVIYDVAFRILQPEEQGVLFSMLTDQSHAFSDTTFEEIKTKSSFVPEETEVNSYIVLNRPIEKVPESEEEKKAAKMMVRSIVKDYITFDNYEVVYDKNSWITLRRQILGNHPGSHEDFVTNCRKYFSEIAFHDNCIKTLIDNNYDYLKTCPRRIVYYLSCLNDKFADTLEKYELGKVDANNLLADFSGTYSLGESGSMQQNFEKKKSLTFKFCNTSDSTYDNKVFVDVLCEPHLKIPRPDDNYTGSWDDKNFHPRIYFNFERKPIIENGKYLVGIMGKHV